MSASLGCKIKDALNYNILYDYMFTLFMLCKIVAHLGCVKFLQIKKANLFAGMQTDIVSNDLNIQIQL